MSEGNEGMTVTDIGGKRKTSDRPPPAEYAGSLAEALCRFQAEMPEVPRTQTGDTGGHSYTYADLASIKKLADPILTRHGLSFMSKPTTIPGALMDGEGPMFVLAYSLHFWPTGEKEEGIYPLDARLSSQARGSAITYGKRQCFCAVLNIAPQDDDDAAAEEAERRAQAAQAVQQQSQRQQQGSRAPLRSARPQQPSPEPDKPPEQPTDNQHSNSVHAQLLAEKAVELTDEEASGTLAQLQADVYEPARTKHLLNAEVVHPMTGEKTRLTVVISQSKKILTGRQANGEQK